MLEPSSVITSKIPLAAADVARHYNELDTFYRDIWGVHVHHGLWDSEHDQRSAEEATQHLLERVTAPLSLLPGEHLADIGCGYGASSRWLANRYGVRVVALTLSDRQAAHAALTTAPGSGEVTYRVEDWLENSLPDGSLDAAIAIESLAHMPDKQRFFVQLHRTLKPGGRAALAVWTTAADLTPLEQRLLIKICEEGRLPGMGTLEEYRQLAEACGFHVLLAQDLSRQVERTWWIIARRVLFGLFTKWHYLRFVFNRAFRERIFLLTLPRLLLAYRTGAMRYGVLVLRKPR